MSKPHAITLKEHNQEVSIYDLVHSMTDEQLAVVLSDVLNSYSVNRKAKAVGEYFVSEHRSLQANFVRFCLDAIVAYSRKYEQAWAGYTDARNEVAVAVANQIVAMIENGDLPSIPFI